MRTDRVSGGFSLVSKGCITEGRREFQGDFGSISGNYRRISASFRGDTGEFSGILEHLRCVTLLGPRRFRKGFGCREYKRRLFRRYKRVSGRLRGGFWKHFRKFFRRFAVDYEGVTEFS